MFLDVISLSLTNRNFLETQEFSTFMVLSADPVTNHWFPGSTAIDLTQPRWPLMTCQTEPDAVTGPLKTESFMEKLQIYPKQFPWWMPLGFRKRRYFPHKWISSSAALHDSL